MVNNWSGLGERLKMRKSTKNFRIAFVLGLLATPFVILTNPANLRLWWFLLPLILLMGSMFIIICKACSEKQVLND